MTPVIPCSASNFAFVPRSTFMTRKNKCVGRFSCLGKLIKQTSLSQIFLLHFPANVRLLPKCHTLRVHRLSGTGIDVEVETENSPTGQGDYVGIPEEPSTSSEPKLDLTVESDATSSPAQSKRSRPPRSSDMPPVKNEDLVPGATFTGKVRSIQPFGAFVHFGAFTDGLVHVSRLSNSFVKDVASVLSVGQEVKVRVVEVNSDSGRIALSMRENDGKDPSSNEKGSPPRSNQNKVDVKKASKFVKEQELVGTVKNLTRSGAFIALPEGEEGFLPTSEEADDGIPNLTGSSSLEVGQEVNVRVLRVNRGQVTLTSKKDQDFKKLDSELNKGVVHTSTNAFVLAFRQNKDIATFLDEREKLELVAQAPESNLDVEEATAAVESVEGTGSVVQNEAEASVVDDVSSVEEVSAGQMEGNPSSDEVVETAPEASTAESAGEISVGQTEDSTENDQASVGDSGDVADQVPAVESSIEEVEAPTSETAIPDATSKEVGEGTAVDSVPVTRL